MKTALAYFILFRIWRHLLNVGDGNAMEVIERLQLECLNERNTDAVRGILVAQGIYEWQESRSVPEVLL